MQPSAWLARWAPLIPERGKILDLACGNGRHLRYLLDRNQPLVGIDINLSGVADLRNTPNVELVEQDLEHDFSGLPDPAYAGIVVTNYLHRPLLKILPAHLGEQGVLVYETFAAGNEQYGRPSNPDFLLETDELVDAFAKELEVVGFEQGFVDTPQPAVIQRICAIKSG